MPLESQDTRDPNSAPDTRAMYAVVAGWNRADVAPFVPQSTAVGVTVTPVVNDGRWLVLCPYCTGAQYASRTDPRFFCVDCLCEQNGRQWVTVVWPDDHADIDVLLSARPRLDPDTSQPTRNWRPGETVSQVVADNDVHDVDVPAEIRAAVAAVGA